MIEVSFSIIRSDIAFETIRNTTFPISSAAYQLALHIYKPPNEFSRLLANRR
jgi:hypothetical protein